MLKARDIEIGVELSIHACKQVQVKRRGDAEGVVIGAKHLRNRLHEISSQQKAITSHEGLAHVSEKLHPRLALEIADRASEKQHQHVFARFTAGSHLPQTLEILSFKTQDADAGQVIELALAKGKCRRGNLDRMIRCGLAARDGLKHPAGLLAGSAPKFSHHERCLHAGSDLIRVTAKNSLVSASQTVFRQDTDDLKERGANL